MDNKPFALTSEEFKQLASHRGLREMWGASDSDEMEMILKDVYTVKFRFVNESPGYVGDLFLIQGGVLDSDIPVVRLLWNSEKKLEILN